MKIRFATLEDIPTFVELGRTFQANTRFKDYPYSPERVAENIKGAIEDQRGIYCPLVAVDSTGKPVGGLLGKIERHFFSEQIVASVIQYNVLPEKRMTGAGLKMLTAFKQWAENRGAVELAVGINSGTNLKQLDRFLRKLGFQMTGGNYSMGLGREI